MAQAGAAHLTRPGKTAGTKWALSALVKRASLLGLLFGLPAILAPTPAALAAADAQPPASPAIWRQFALKEKFTAPGNADCRGTGTAGLSDERDASINQERNRYDRNETRN